MRSLSKKLLPYLLLILIGHGTSQASFVDSGLGSYQNDSKGRSVVRTLDGRLWAFYNSYELNEGDSLSYSISTDEGQTWKPRQKLLWREFSYCTDNSAHPMTRSYSASSPSAAVDSEGVIHVVFSGGGVWHTRLENECWTQPEMVGSDFSEPGIFVDAYDNLHVVGSGNVDGDYGVIYYKKLHGGTWDRVGGYAKGLLNYAAGVDQDELHLAYLKTDQDTYQGTGQLVFHGRVDKDGAFHSEMIENNHCCSDPPDDKDFERPPYSLDIYHNAGLEIGMEVMSRDFVTIYYFRQNPAEKFIPGLPEERRDFWYNQQIGVWKAEGGEGSWSKGQASKTFNPFLSQARAHSLIESFSSSGGPKAIWNATNDDDAYNPRDLEPVYNPFKATYVDSVKIQESAVLDDGYGGSGFINIMPRSARWNNNGGRAGFLYSNLEGQHTLNYYPLNYSMGVQRGVGTKPPPEIPQCDDIFAVDEDGDGFETVTLPSCGVSPDGPVESYQWAEYTNGDGISQYLGTSHEPHLEYTFEVRSHEISHRVNVSGKSPQDSDFLVTVLPKGSHLPVAKAGPDQIITVFGNDQKATVELDGSASYHPDPKRRIKQYVWFYEPMHAPAQILADAKIKIQDLGVGTHKFSLEVWDDLNFIDSDDVAITVTTGGGSVVVADAGEDQTLILPDAATAVAAQLNGSASVGAISSYRWVDEITKQELATGKSSLVSLGRGIHRVVLTVSNAAGKTDKDTVIIRVKYAGDPDPGDPNPIPDPNPPVDNTPPIADGCGDRIIITNDPTKPTPVTFTSCSSDPDGTITTYAWAEYTTGSGFTSTIYMGPNSSVTSEFYGWEFSQRDTRTHEVEHVVFDNDGAVARDSFLVTIMTPNTQLPVADAGADQVIHVNNATDKVTVHLDGSASTHPDPARRLVTYDWFLAPIFQFPITDPSYSQYQRSVVGPGKLDIQLGVGVYKFRLQVWDDAQYVDRDEVTIRITTDIVDPAPTANAGPDQTLALPDNVTTMDINLDGSASHDNGPITYQWKNEATQQIMASVAKPKISLGAGIHRILLTVTDQNDSKDSDLVIVTITEATPANTAPDVVTGPQKTAVALKPLTIDATITDDGRPTGTITTAWEQTSGPGRVIFVSPKTITTDVVFTAPGTYVLKLTADDGEKTGVGELTVNVQAPNEAPQVNAGPDRGAIQSRPLAIDAGVSDDGLPGGAATYFWEKVLGPGDVDFNPQRAVDTNATFSQPGDYVIKLTANDSSLSTSDELNVTVFPADTRSVNITSPDHLAHLSGTVNFSVSAADTDGIKRVEFYINDTRVHTAFAPPYEYSWNTINETDGMKSLYAIAYDNLEHPTSDGRMVIVDNTDPTVVLNEPLNSVIISNNQWLKATATDNDQIKKVEFVVRGAVVNVDQVAPYEYILITSQFPDGPALIEAIATDLAGNQGRSFINVTIHNIDTIAPTVSVASPNKGASVKDTIVMRINAQDDFAVQSVCVHFADPDGFGGVGPNIPCDDKAPYEFEFNTHLLPDGAYAIFPEAYDYGGNRGRLEPFPDRRSKAHVITINNNDASESYPTISITSPSNGSQVTGVVPITVAAAKDGNPNLVQRVEYEVRTFAPFIVHQTFTNTAPPFTFNWDTTALKNKGFTIQATAYDADGRFTSTWVDLIVHHPDTTPPTIQITSPSNGSVLRGFEAINADVSDNQDIMTVQLWVDGVQRPSSDTLPPFNVVFNTMVEKQGPHTVTLKAIDIYSNEASDSISVTVDNPGANPEMRILSPENNARLTGPANVDVDVNDPQGAAKVEYFVDSNLIASDTEAPFSYLWEMTKADNGPHTLSAKAFDVVGNNTSASINVTVQINTPPTVNVGLDRTVMIPNAVTIAPVVGDDGNPTPPSLTYAWSKIFGPEGETITPSNAANTVVSFTNPGDYLLRLTVSDGAASTSDDVIVTVLKNNAPVVSAGSDATVMIPNAVTLNGSVSDDHLPNPPDALTAAWSMQSGPVGGDVRFTDKNSVNTTATFTAPGVYVLRLTGDDSLLSGTDEVTITVLKNSAPVVNAGSDATVMMPNAVTLDGSVSDDHLPNPPDALTAVWSMQSGPVGGDVRFTDKNSVNTTATFTAPGVYVLRLTGDDSLLSGTDDVTITVLKNGAPVVNAGSDATVMMPNAVMLDGSVSDDHLPNPPDALTAAWSMQSGPVGGDVRFTDKNSIDTTATFTAPGEYVLRLTADDSVLSAYDEVTVTANMANTAPFVNTGINQTINLSDRLALDATVTDDGMPNPPGVLDYTWEKMSGPGDIDFATPKAEDTTATFTAAGTYVLRLTVFDGELTRFDEMSVSVLPPNTPPVVSVGDDQIITLPAAAIIDAHVSDDGLPNPPHALTYTWTSESGPGTVTFVSDKEDTRATFAKDGIYVLRLTVRDGQFTSYDEVQVTVNPQAPNVPPIADGCGDIFVLTPDASTPQTVRIVSCSSDPDGSITRYIWSEYTINSFYFTTPKNFTDATLSPKSYGVVHYVIDDRLAVSTSPFLITVLPPNTHLPVANAGADQVLHVNNPDQKASVRLSGAASYHPDPNRSLANFTWYAEPGHEKINILPRTDIFMNLGVGVYRFRLEVWDDAHYIDSDEVVVTVTQGTANKAPAANAGANRTLDLPAGANTVDVVLDGSKSVDTDGTIASYHWVRETDKEHLGDGVRPTVSLSPGIHRIVLTTTDNSGNSDKSTVIIEVKGTAARPRESLSASVGEDQIIALVAYGGGAFNAETTLTGTVTGNPTSVEWSMANCSGGACGDISFDSPGALTTTARFSKPGVYRVAFKASNSAGDAFAYMNVTVDPSSLGAGTGLEIPEPSKTIEPTEVVENAMFNPLQGMVSTIRYTTLVPDTISIIIYDSLGHYVRTLFNGYVAANTYTAQWDGRDDGGQIVTSGVYHIITQAGSVQNKTKIIVAK